MAEDVSPDHLKLFPLHDDIITRTVEINDKYRLKMMYYLIWLNQKATMLVISFEYLLIMFSFNFSISTTFMCQIILWIMWYIYLRFICLFVINSTSRTCSTTSSHSLCIVPLSFLFCSFHVFCWTRISFFIFIGDGDHFCFVRLETNLC